MAGKTGQRDLGHAPNPAIEQSFLVTLKNWFELILNYFIERWMNAFAEGVNNKIKLIKRRAFGFANFDHFRLRILVECVPNPT